MNFRHYYYRELCSHACHNIAKGTCARCSKPLCEQHLPQRDRRCQECELQFANRHPVLDPNATIIPWVDLNISPSPHTVGLMKGSALIGVSALLASLWIMIPSAGSVPTYTVVGLLLILFATSMAVSLASMAMIFLQPAARAGAQTLKDTLARTKTTVSQRLWQRARRKFLNEYKGKKRALNRRFA